MHRRPIRILFNDTLLLRSTALIRYTGQGLHFLNNHTQHRYIYIQAVSSYIHTYMSSCIRIYLLSIFRTPRIKIFSHHLQIFPSFTLMIKFVTYIVILSYFFIKLLMSPCPISVYQCIDVYHCVKPFNCSICFNF